LKVLNGLAENPELDIAEELFGSAVN